MTCVISRSGLLSAWLFSIYVTPGFSFLFFSFFLFPYLVLVLSPFRHPAVSDSPSPPPPLLWRWVGRVEYGIIWDGMVRDGEGGEGGDVLDLFGLVARSEEGLGSLKTKKKLRLTKYRTERGVGGGRGVREMR